MGSAKVKVLRRKRQVCGFSGALDQKIYNHPGGSMADACRIGERRSARIVSSH
jgi:hypothetical protein